MSVIKVPKSELDNRLSRFTAAMDKEHPNWEMCAITGGVSMYYFTGTICNGMLFLRRGKDAVLWVRRSYERAVLESNFAHIKPMSSFKDVAASVGTLSDTLHLDMSEATMEWYGLLSRHMPFKNVLPADKTLLRVRAVKSAYEIELIRRAGTAVNRILTEDVPQFLYAGMSEADLGGELYSLFIKNGYHGVSRFTMRNADVVLGHIGFGESSFYPSVFNGASGTVGLTPATPVLGNRDIKLKEGDLVYVDVCFGVEGYNVDRTMIFSFKSAQDEHINGIQHHCLELERLAASMLNAGTKPSDIYATVIEKVRPDLRDRFMGARGRTVPFLGHGVGLYVDELPVLAKGFDEPLECGMTIAIEPKVGLEGKGILGSENTYLVTKNGAESLTGEARELVVVN